MVMTQKKTLGLMVMGILLIGTVPAYAQQSDDILNKPLRWGIGSDSSFHGLKLAIENIELWAVGIGKSESVASEARAELALQQSEERLRELSIELEKVENEEPTKTLSENEDIKETQELKRLEREKRVEQLKILYQEKVDDALENAEKADSDRFGLAVSEFVHSTIETHEKKIGELVSEFVQNAKPVDDADTQRATFKTDVERELTDLKEIVAEKKKNAKKMKDLRTANIKGVGVDGVP